MEPEKAKKYRPQPLIFSYNARDTIIYALGIGASPADDLHFLYENHDNFQVFPTYSVAPSLAANTLHDWPGIPFNYSKILHGEQYIEQFEPLPAGEAELRAEIQVVDILDKGSGALILSEVTIYNNKTNKKLGIQQFGTFQVGSGNFGGNKSSPHERKGFNVPSSTPHKILETVVEKNQAALYRQGGGDLNPLHIDRQFAKTAGFDQPILHGLCSLGIVTRQILCEYGNNETVNFKAVKVRFSAPVYPGQTLVTETWKAENRIYFQTKIKTTGKVVLASSYVDLFKTNTVNKTNSNLLSTTAISLKSASLFAEIGAQLHANLKAISNVNAIILYDITTGGKHAAYYTLDLKNQPFSVYNHKPNTSEKVAVTVTVDDEDFVKLAAGKLDGLKAFMSGKLKIRGNILLMQKLQKVLSSIQNKSKL